MYVCMYVLKVLKIMIATVRITAEKHKPLGLYLFRSQGALTPALYSYQLTAVKSKKLVWDR